MSECPSITLQNTNGVSTLISDDDSRIRRVLGDIERLITMLNNDTDIALINASSLPTPQPIRINPSFYCPSPSTSMTNVTFNEDHNYRLIEHLRHRVARLEHERSVLLTSYQLLIQLLK